VLIGSKKIDDVLGETVLARSHEFFSSSAMMGFKGTVTSGKKFRPIDPRHPARVGSTGLRR